MKRFIAVIMCMVFMFAVGMNVAYSKSSNGGGHGQAAANSLNHPDSNIKDRST